MNSQKTHKILFALILFCGLATGINAQDFDTRPMRGFMPNMDQLSSSIDNIDIATGKLNLTIPLGSLPRGKGGTSYELNLQYESNIYDLETNSGTMCVFNEINSTTTCAPWSYTSINPAPALGGWRYNSKPYRIDIEETNPSITWHVNNGVISSAANTPCSASDPWVIQQLFRYRVILPDGSEHILYLKDYEYHNQGGGFYPITMSGTVDACYFQYHYGPQTVSGLQTWYTIDGSNLRYEVFATGQSNTYTPQAGMLYFPDGRVVEWEGTNIVREIDANGNAITFETICTGTYQECAAGINVTDKISDADGRTITIEYDWDEDSGWRRNKVSIPGPNGDSVYYIDWEPQLGGTLIYSTGIIPGNNPPVDKNEALNISFKGLKYIHLPTAIQLPPLGTAPDAADSYEFGYWLSGEGCNMPTNDGFGMLNYMRTPSGSEYRYVYGYRNYLQETEATKLVHGAYVCQKTVTTTDPNQELKWEFENLSNKTTVKKADGNETIYNYNYKPGGLWDSGLLNMIEEYEGLTKKREQKRFWSYSSVSIQGAVHTPANAWMTKELVSVFDNNGNGVKSAITAYNRDVNGNLLEKTEYDWVPYNTLNGSTVYRRTTYDYYIPAGTTYWNHNNTNLRRLNAVKRVTVYDGSNNAKAATEYEYDDPYTTGNVLKEKRWDNTRPGAASLALGSLPDAHAQVFTYSYDQYGNVIEKTEPSVGAVGQPKTRLTYDATGSHVIKVETGYNKPEKRTMEYEWRNGGAALWKKIDSDNDLTTEYTYDDAGRVLEVKESSVSGNLRRAWTEYDDVNLTVTVKSDLKTYSDGLLQTKTHYDQLGRAYLIQQSDGSALVSDTDGIKVETIYSFPMNGRRVITSTPYRLTSDLTLEWSCTQYDTLDRITLVSTFKGSAPPVDCEQPNPLNSNTNFTGATQMFYDAEYTTVIDPDEKKRQQKVDALGRLIEVIEDPQDGNPNRLNYITTYAYDALDNLTGVTQIQASPSATQTRTFTYSSLSRLLSAVNPESGTTSYTYHDSGDLWTKTDARIVTSTMTYDALHRVTGKTYNDNNVTPNVTYEYHQASGDSSAPNIGQLKSVISSVSATTYGYNTLGQVISSSQTIDGYGTKAFSYDWYLNGALKQQMYPSGKIVNYDVDNAGRTTVVNSGVVNYADVTAYTADGRITEMLLGNGLYETRDYLTPGTPTIYRLETSNGVNLTQIEYDFAAQRNNGNVQAQRIVRNNTTWSQSYGYDAVNRLSFASEAGGWNRTYGYDRYGNRYVTTLNSDPLEPTQLSDFDAANNRLATIQGVREYDAAGNLIKHDGMTLVYDAEGRNVSASGSGGTVTFFYDGEGRRVKKAYGGVDTYYVYNALGQLAAEYDNNPTPVTPGTSYLFTDMLGSVRTITNSSGNVIECYDYLPFGRILSASDNGRSAAGCHPSAPDTNLTSSVDEKFTGQKRDNETGLDYFGARYFSAPLGRFTSPDPIWVNAARMLDPQRLNLYAYTRNNPLKYIDPTGLELQMGDCGDYPASWCFEMLKRGLRKEDRDAVSLIKGTGENNCSKGATCVSVTAGYESNDENFQTLIKAVNNSSIARLDVLKEGDPVTIMTSSWSKEAGYTPSGTSAFKMEGRLNPFAGYTFFEYLGKSEPGAMYTPGKYSQAVINSSQMTDIEIIEAMHHEIRHIVLGDFGRTIPKSMHSSNFNFDGIPINEADRQTLSAGQKAVINATK